MRFITIISSPLPECTYTNRPATIAPNIFRLWIDRLAVYCKVMWYGTAILSGEQEQDQDPSAA